jgi:hypothetical protein
MYQQPVVAQFGLGRDMKMKEAVVNTMDQPEIGMDLEDPDLLAAIEMFSKMSPQEMEDTMNELKDILGDDPESLEAMQQVMSEITQLSAMDIKSSLKDIIADDEIQAATDDALRILQSTDQSWESIWEQRETILEAVLASEKLSPEDAIQFRNNPLEWEAELKHIWEELMKQAESFDSAKK